MTALRVTAFGPDPKTGSEQKLVVRYVGAGHALDIPIGSRRRLVIEEMRLPKARRHRP